MLVIFFSSILLMCGLFNFVVYFILLHVHTPYVFLITLIVIAPYAAEAAYNLGRWSFMETCVNALNPNTSQGYAVACFCLCFRFSCMSAVFIDYT